jgi:hypothetical protein
VTALVSIVLFAVRAKLDCNYNFADARKKEQLAAFAVLRLVPMVSSVPKPTWLSTARRRLFMSFEMMTGYMWEICLD